MDESTKYVVGLDVGTENVRAVVATVKRDDTLTVVGYGEGPNSGMRKGVVANLSGPAQAIDQMLTSVERMAGYNVDSAYVSINGAHVMSVKAEGMIAVGAEEHEITLNDMERVKQAAVTGRVAANREVLKVLPLSYTLDGQSGIKDPLGMTGTRLEIKAGVLSALTPNTLNLRKATEGADLAATELVPSVVAAARAVLTDRQRENGVAVVDFGAATTGVAIYEEGDLQYVGVLPVGSMNITNDLAIVLQIDTEMAEEIKRRFVMPKSPEQKLGDLARSGVALGEAERNYPREDETLVIRHGREEMAFSRALIAQTVTDRLAEIFAGVQKEIKTAHYDRKLPEGAVLVGGGARLRDLPMLAKSALAMSAKLGVPGGLAGVAEAVEKPEYAAAVGLALLAADGGADQAEIKPAKKHWFWRKKNR